MEEKKLEETNFEEKKKSNTKKIILIAIGLISLVIYFTVPSVKQFINKIFTMFATGDFDTIRNFIDSYGVYAAAISFFLMVFSSIWAPLPAFFVTLTNANLFGWLKGAILSWSSAMAGAALCFYISKILGRDVVEKLTGKGALESVDEYFERYGSKTILICRLLPFVSFDIVSYAAGLTSMKFWPFFIATGIGQLPATIVYSYVGGQLTGGAKIMFIALLSLFALALLISIGRKIYQERSKTAK